MYLHTCVRLQRLWYGVSVCLWAHIDLCVREGGTDRLETHQNVIRAHFGGSRYNESILFSLSDFAAFSQIPTKCFHN